MQGCPGWSVRSLAATWIWASNRKVGLLKAALAEGRESEGEGERESAKGDVEPCY